MNTILIDSTQTFGPCSDRDDLLEGNFNIDQNFPMNFNLPLRIEFYQLQKIAKLMKSKSLDAVNTEIQHQNVN